MVGVATLGYFPHATLEALLLRSMSLGSRLLGMWLFEFLIEDTMFLACSAARSTTLWKGDLSRPS